tara:strand:+ start:162 stop:458 length:297 start_codon:yes stop_codon:yes gene_type:complete
MQLSSHRNKVIARLIKNDYFFFTGQNSTIGNAHPTTGNRDTYGFTYRFKTKAAAVEFYNDYSHAPIQRVGKARAIRTFHLGTSVANFNEHLNDLEYEA